MGLFETVRKWLSPKPPATDAEQKLRLLLRTSLEIVSSYGATIERPINYGVPIIDQPDTQLPCSKQQIAQAIAVLQQALKRPDLRAMLVQMLSPIEAQKVLSPQFEKSLESGLALLDTFVPISQVETERKQWEEALNAMDKIDPEVRSRIEKMQYEAQNGKLPKNEAT